MGEEREDRREKRGEKREGRGEEGERRGKRGEEKAEERERREDDPGPKFPDWCRALGFVIFATFQDEIRGLVLFQAQPCVLRRCAAQADAR